MDLKMVYIDPVTRRATIKLVPQEVSGIDLLVQTVILSLLTNPESDLLDPNDGGGLRELIGTNYDPDDLSELYTEVSRRVAKTEAEIIDNQIGLDVTAEERLSRIDIVSLQPGLQDGVVDLRLRVENELGRTRNVVI